MVRVVRSTGSDVRSKAIITATILVRRYGSDKFRLTDVAKEMGVTHAALYKYFKNKEDLLDSINAEWLMRIDQELETIVNQDEEVLIRIKRWFMRLYEMKQEKAQLDIEPYAALIDATIKQKSYVREHLKIQFEQLNRLCEEALATHKIKKDSHKITGLLLEATLAFHNPKFVKDALGTDRSDNLSSLLDILISGIFRNPTKL